MGLSYQNELARLSSTRRFISLLPRKMRFRAAKALYNYESAQVNGIDLVAPLQQDGAVCFINSKDIIGWMIFFFGEYEASTNRILAEYVKPGHTVIEAGANIGSESVLIGRMAGNGQVYCFEPNPYSFERLRINMAINELTNVHAFDCALGEKNGSISFNIFPKGYCNPGMSSKYMETPQTKKISVAQQTLDAFVAEQQITKVDLIKMDIQGAEMDMLMGGESTISRFRPVLFTEASVLYNNTTDMYRMLQRWGYDVFLLRERDKVLMGSESEIVDGNWLAIAKK